MGMIRINDGRVIVAIPSMRKIGESKWAVYFMEDNQLYTAIYYTEEKARHRYEKELEKCTRERVCFFVRKIFEKTLKKILKNY